MGNYKTAEARSRGRSAKKKAAPITPRKATAKSRLAMSSTKADQAKAKAKAKATSQHKKDKKPRFHKQILIIMSAVFLVFDLAMLGIWGLQRPEAMVPPSADPATLISKQLITSDLDHNISLVGYDTTLSFANLQGLTIIPDLSLLQPIENNLYKKAAASGGSDLLYDEMIVWRIISFNSTWVEFLNDGARNVYSSVETASTAEAKVAQLGRDSRIYLTRLSFGEIGHIDQTYYIIVQADYTLFNGEQADVHTDIFVYQLIPKGNTMLIEDFQQFIQLA